MHRRVLNPLLVFALVASAFALGGCVRSPTRNPQPTPEWLSPPGRVDMEQALAVVGKGAKHRLSIRAAPLFDAGLLSLVMDAIPRAQRARYDQFVNKSGFNAAKRAAGLVVYMDGELASYKTSNPTFVVGFDGAISERLIDAIEEWDDDDDDGDDDDDDDGDDDDDDNESITIVVLVELPDNVRARLRPAMDKVKDGKELLVTKEIGEAVLRIDREGKKLKYTYIWSGGLIFGELPATSGKLLDTVSKPLAAVLGELAVAARATGQPSKAVLEGRGSGNGLSAEFSVSVTERAVLKLTIKPRSEDLAKADQMLAAIPTLKSQPEKALGRVPPFAHELLRLVLPNISGSRDGDEVSVRISVETEALKSALRPIVKAASAM